jgi:hypothetical protein
MVIYPRKFIITKCSTKLQRTKSAKARSGGKSCKLKEHVTSGKNELLSGSLWRTLICFAFIVGCKTGKAKGRRVRRTKEKKKKNTVCLPMVPAKVRITKAH